MDAQLSICIYAKADPLIRSLSQQLGSDRYICHLFSQQAELLSFIADQKTDIDCLIIQNTEADLSVLNELYAHGILLPIVIIEPAQSQNTATEHKDHGRLLNPTQYLYHTGEVRLLGSEIAQIATTIDRAIAQFLKLTPTRPPNPTNPINADPRN